MTSRKIYLLFECIFLFFIIPTILYYYRHYFAFKIVPIVGILSILAFFILKFDSRFDKKIFFNHSQLIKHLKEILIIFTVFGAILSILVYLYANQLFLGFPKKKPIVWFLVMIFYPILAVYPQEVIFRGFFFHRYSELFSNKMSLIVVNALLFGYCHIIYANLIAPLLSTLGGILFAYRYLSSKSLLITSIEHALWGNFIFTIGLGWFFYSGAILAK